MREQWRTEDLDAPIDGSSPRVRGTVPIPPCLRPCAYQSVHPRACGEQAALHLREDRRSTTVHPRACGEQHRPMQARIEYPGTSVHPRACGEQARVPHLVEGMTRPPVHPRACGELSRSGLRSYERLKGIGSSPRVRGTVFSSDLRHWLARSTVHPRACGGTGSERAYVSVVKNYGSSPRVRGTLSAVGWVLQTREERLSRELARAEP